MKIGAHTMTIARCCAAGLIAATFASGTPCFAQDVVKVGLIVPLTGPFTSAGKQLVAGARLYMQLKGDTVAGKKIELVIKDDTGSAEITKRLAQELVVNDKVSFLAGFGLTARRVGHGGDRNPKRKIPEVVMMATTSVITERSPYIVRTEFLGLHRRRPLPLATWAAEERDQESGNGASPDYAPRNRCRRLPSSKRFEALGGQVVMSLRVPLANPRISRRFFSVSLKSGPMRCSALSLRRRADFHREHGAVRPSRGLSTNPGSSSSPKATADGGRYRQPDRRRRRSAS